MPPLDALIAFFENLGRNDLERFADFYAEDAYFKDPFNELRGVAAITQVFAHMFETVEAPRFRITERFPSEGGAMLLWTFHFLMRGRQQTITGASHLRFDASGKINFHYDYWDAAEELYEKLPLLGALLRALKRRLGAAAP
ncbi:steroid Delta-isomerase [Burkholderiales bacterium]|nr:MAG: nuclear transport factor 2 family protein [Burkholderiales bacterium]CAG0952592.1 steroid Delta-isomerase [Burkholderiales bacterium]